MKRIAKWLENHWIIRILDSLTKFGIIIVVVSWVIDLPEQKKQRETTKRLAIYKAHEILALSTFRSTPAVGLALEDLLKSNMDLRGMDLTELNISKVDLSNANFSNVDFGESTFNDVNLSYTNLTMVELTKINFINVNMKGAKLHNALFAGANLQGAINLTSAQLNSAIICDDTILPKSIILKNKGITKKQKNIWLKKYKNSEYIKSTLKSCVLQ